MQTRHSPKAKTRRRSPGPARQPRTRSSPHSKLTTTTTRLSTIRSSCTLHSRTVARAHDVQIACRVGAQSTSSLTLSPPRPRPFLSPHHLRTSVGQGVHGHAYRHLFCRSQTSLITLPSLPMLISMPSSSFSLRYLTNKPSQSSLINKGEKTPKRR